MIGAFAVPESDQTVARAFVQAIIKTCAAHKITIVACDSLPSIIDTEAGINGFCTERITRAVEYGQREIKTTIMFKRDRQQKSPPAKKSSTKSSNSKKGPVTKERPHSSRANKK